MRDSEILKGGALLHRQLRERLRRDIVSGVYPAHGRIPSEMELCRTHGVSRVTVRKALDALVDEGLLERYQGKGTYVSPPRLNRSLREVNSFSDTCRAMGRVPTTQLISARMTQGEEDVCAELMCAPEEGLVELVRLRLADGMPVMLEINHFSAAYEWLLNDPLDASLYALLKTKGIEPGKAIHEISLCHADDRDSRWLDVEKGGALLALNETIYDAQGNPLHTSRQHIRGDRFAFRI